MSDAHTHSGAHDPDASRASASPENLQAASSEEMSDRAKRAAGKAALKDLLKPVRGALMVGRILAVLSSVVMIAPYIALTRISSLLLEAHDAGTAVDAQALRAEVWFLIGAFVTYLGIYFFALTLTHFADLRLMMSLRERILDRIARAPLSWFSNSTSGAIRKSVQDDTQTLHTLVAHAPVETTAAIATPVVLLSYAFWIDWRLALLAILTYPIYIALQVRMLNDMGPKTATLDTKLSAVSSTGAEFAEGIAVVKNFGRTGKAHARFARAAQDFADFYWDWCGPLLRGSALSLAVISAPLLLFINLTGGALMMRAGWVGLPEVLTCTLISLVLPMGIEVLGMTAWSYQQAGNSALRLVRVLATEQIEPIDPAVESARRAHSRPVGDGAVRFENVSYAYICDGTRIQALEDVSLDLPAGSITALVGPSGSGKSTLATMLARFRDPDSGRILIDGVDLRDMSEAELYANVAFVLQEAHLLRMSIRDNIALAKPEASDEEVWNAARSAMIAADIEQLEHGLDTIVGEQTDLSGGQRQRIAIARALLADTPILVLDEATTATDPDCEAEIQRALNRLVAGRTVLVIAHHAESVRGVDQICVMADGKVDAVGAPLDISENPYWRHLAGAASEGTHHV
ncbi:MAG: ABC transporter ATP-binding protein [Bowdeniella nasicola]|nr:ABC transporter ATP-binding protein [Bowdeniella nasicola]